MVPNCRPWHGARCACRKSRGENGHHPSDCLLFRHQTHQVCNFGLGVEGGVVRGSPGGGAGSKWLTQLEHLLSRLQQAIRVSVAICSTRGSKWQWCDTPSLPCLVYSTCTKPIFTRSPGGQIQIQRCNPASPWWTPLSCSPLSPRWVQDNQLLGVAARVAYRWRSVIIPPMHWLYG